MTNGPEGPKGPKFNIRRLPTGTPAQPAQPVQDKRGIGSPRPTKVIGPITCPPITPMELYELLDEAVAAVVPESDTPPPLVELIEEPESEILFTEIAPASPRKMQASTHLPAIPMQLQVTQFTAMAARETPAGFEVAGVAGVMIEAHIGIERMVELTRDYYINWPNAYSFTPRSISSLWQAPQFCDHAMGLFLLEEAGAEKETAIEIGITALGIFNEMSGTNFDQRDITGFRILRSPDGPYFRITVSW